MDLAVDDRAYYGTKTNDKIITTMDGIGYASAYSVNARSFKLYDGETQGISYLLGAEALSLAGRQVEIPIAPFVYLDYMAAVSYDGI